MSADAAKPAAPRAEMPDLASCELERELGTTTEGPTLVVREAASGRCFVLKLYDKSVLRDPEFIHRVHQDATLASRIQHPNVVRVLGAREWLGDLVVVREYVEGASLAEILKSKGKLGTQEAVSVALATAMALDQGQRVGLLHEAISPTNLLVARDGSVKLADLGVAKPRPIEPSITKTGPGVRSPRYLAPEYFELRTPLDKRSDLFSLGAVLYQGLTGKQPFQGDTTAEVTFAIRNGIFRPLREVAPDAPRSLATIVEKLLQKNPAERYESPAALLEDLQALQAGRVPQAQRKAVAEAVREKEQAAAKPAASVPAPAQPAAEAEREAPATRRKWTWIAAAAIAVVLAGLFVTLVLRGRPKPAGKKGEEPVPDTAVRPDDPAARARKAREELEALRKSPGPGKEADPSKKLAAAQDKLLKLKEFAERYKDTAEAAEARKQIAAEEAEAAFQSALVFEREHPKDREGLAHLLRALVAKHAKTEAGYKAERRLDELEDTERKKAQAQFDQARGRARDLAAKKRYGEALAAFDELLAANPTEAIKQAILLEKNAVTSDAERAYQDIQKRAQEKISGNYYEEAKALYEQVVATFGVEPFVGRAKGELAVLAPLLKSAAARRLEAIDAAKYQFFLTRLEPSLALARTWELAAAGAAAEKARADLKTAGIETYLDAYLGDLAVLSSLKVRVVQRLNDAARPVAVRDFSLGKVGGKFDPQWLDAKVVSADDAAVLFRYGQLDVRRPWGKFLPDELYKLGVLATDIADPQSHLALGIHCLYAALPTIAARELHLAKAGAPEAAASYLQRLDVVLAREKAPAPAAGPQEEASRLFLEAKRYMNEQAWDRALYRLATLREKHLSKVYDVSANLDEINQRIAQCKKQVEKLAIETNLALGREVTPLRESLFDEWQQRFGKWDLAKGVLAAKNTEEQDAECLFTLRHPPAYELRAKVRIVEGTGAILRLAGKARPNIGFWANAAKPDLVGLLFEQPADQQAAERKNQPFTFKPGEWYEIRATVSPVNVEVTIGDNYAVRMPNKLPPDPGGLQTYGFLLNPKSAAEFRDFTIRTLREQ